MLSKKEILECSDIPTEVVPVPEWDGEVTVKGLSLKQKDAFRDSLTVGGELVVTGATAKLCAWCMVDGKGTRIFSDSDVEALSDKSPLAIDRVFEAAQRVSGMDEDIEGAVKNSETTQTPDSD